MRELSHTTPVHPSRMSNLTVQHLHRQKTHLHAVFQIAPGGGFTQARLAHHLIHRKTVRRLVVKQHLHPRQRVLLYPFAAVVRAIVFACN